MSTVKIVHGDRDFYMVDGIKLVPRACIEISASCPDYLKSMILNAVSNGELQAVAYVPEKELFWEKLSA